MNKELTFFSVAAAIIIIALIWFIHWFVKNELRKAKKMFKDYYDGE